MPFGHRHQWAITPVFVVGEYRKRDCLNDKYTPKNGDAIRRAGHFAYCQATSCECLGIALADQPGRVEEIDTP